MLASEATVGRRVRTMRPFASVPKGTPGVIDADYGTGVMVAWDLPDHPLPAGYKVWDKKPAIATGILRDGFAYDELLYLHLEDGLERVQVKVPAGTVVTIAGSPLTLVNDTSMEADADLFEKVDS